MNAQTRVEDAEFFVMPDPAAEMPGSFRLLSVSTAGDQVFGAFTPAGEFTASQFMLIGRDGSIEVIARIDDQLVDGAGQALGRLDGVNTGQFLSNGALLIEARLIDAPGAPDSRDFRYILRFENGAFQRPPITEVGDQLVGVLEFRGRTAGASSQRFWTLRLNTAPNQDRYRLTDGFTVLDEIFVQGGSETDPSTGLGTLTQQSVLASSATELLIRERIAEQALDSNDRLIDNVTERLFVTGGGQSRDLMTAQSVVSGGSTGTPTCEGTTLEGVAGITPTGTLGQAFAINDAGQVLARLRSSCSAGASSTIFRFEPDGVRAPLFEDSFLANTGLVTHGILASGEVVATAGPAASRGLVLGTPGSSRLLLLANDEIEDTIVGRVIDPVTVAGPSIAIAYETPPGSGASRIAIARLAGNEFSWTADFGGEWGDQDNWNPRGVPGTNDDTVFDVEAAYVVEFDTLRRARSTRVQRGLVDFVGTLLELEESLSIGGNALLRVQGGVLARDVVVGHAASAADPLSTLAELELYADPGDFTTLTSTASLVVGDAVAGRLRFDNAVSQSGEALIGRGARGEASVTGNQARWTIQSLGVGGTNGGWLSIEQGGRLTTDDAVVGFSAVPSAERAFVTLSSMGDGEQRRTEWDIGGILTVGSSSPGSVLVGEGAALRAGGLIQLGASDPSLSILRDGFMQVAGVANGLPSTLESQSDLLMGLTPGVDTRVQVLEGGRVSIDGALSIGLEENSTGVFIVDGVHTSGLRSMAAVPDNTAAVGVSGNGRLQISNGALFEADRVRIGGLPGSQGLVQVAGSAGGQDATLRAAIVCIGGAILGCGTGTEDRPNVRGTLVLGPGGVVETSTGVIVGALGRLLGAGALRFVFEGGFQGALLVTEGGEVAPGIEVLDTTIAEPDEPSTSPARSQPGMARSHALGHPSPGVLEVNGPVTFGEGSTLRVDIEGADSAAQDRLLVGGELTIEPGARLVLEFGNGYAPSQGDTFVFLVAEAIEGAFSEIEVLGLQPGFQFTVGTEPDGLTLLALNNGVSASDPDDNGGENPPPGPIVFEVGEGQRVTCDAVDCTATRREEGQPDPGADLVVEARGLEVAGAGEVRSADITALVHAGGEGRPAAAQHSLVGYDDNGAELFETSALIELPGSDTRIELDAEGLPVVITEAQSEAGLAYSIEAHAEGLALHEVRDAEEALVARITSRVAGADAAVAEDGTLQVRVTAGELRRAVVEMRPDGVLITRFERLENNEWQLLQRTLDVINDFASGSEVLIEDGEVGVGFVIESPLADALVF